MKNILICFLTFTLFANSLAFARKDQEPVTVKSSCEQISAISTVQLAASKILNVSKGLVSLFGVGLAFAYVSSVLNSTAPENWKFVALYFTQVSLGVTLATTTPLNLRIVPQIAKWGMKKLSGSLIHPIRQLTPKISDMMYWLYFIQSEELDTNRQGARWVISQINNIFFPRLTEALRALKNGDTVYASSQIAYCAVYIRNYHPEIPTNSAFVYDIVRSAFFDHYRLSDAPNLMEKIFEQIRIQDGSWDHEVQDVFYEPLFQEWIKPRSGEDSRLHGTHQPKWLLRVHSLI